MRIAIPTLRRLALLAALSLLVALTLCLSAPRTLADAGGSVSGVVQNGTHGSVAVAGQQVTLQQTLGATMRDVATTTTDASGHFAFPGLTGAALGSYAVYTHYQGGVFAAGPLNLESNPNQSTTLLVYDATQDSANLSVSVATILIRQPDAKHGLVGVGEFITVRNSGNTAFVGSMPASGGAMPALLRFYLPPTAESVRTGVGFFNTETIAVGTGFGAAATVPPGQTEFAFAFEMPYTGTTLTVPFKAEYPTGQVVALVPPNMLVNSSSGIAAQGIVTSFGSRYQVYTANDVPHDAQLAVNLYALPQAGERQDLNSGGLLWLAGVLVVILALLLALYLWRGALAVFFGLIPASALAPSDTAADAPASVAPSAAERDRLLRALLASERRRASGALSEEQFKREDASLRERLRALLAADPSLAEALAAARDAAPETAPSGGQR